MAESNGELLEGDVSAAKSDDRGDGERTEDYSKLLEYGLDKKVSRPLGINSLSLQRRNGELMHN